MRNLTEIETELVSGGTDQSTVAWAYAAYQQLQLNTITVTGDRLTLDDLNAMNTPLTINLEGLEIIEEKWQFPK